MIHYAIVGGAAALFATALLFYHLGYADGFSKATNLWRKK
jgi:hypothetical protein